MNNFTKIKELTSVTETYSKESQDICKRKSQGWLERFMPRNGLCLRHRTTQAQKTPEQKTDKMISYISYIRQLKQRNKYDMDCIIAMDETAVWHEMISHTTVTDK